ncbi:MAG: pilus assembly protein [Candidatus Jettenia sp.]|uniref:Lipoprotein n=1 Tax=Candidatus Jettenia caeni TaxID=247490 RepID=I3INZ6_9BACT|nr:hypothetical protein [Candidatus Jettenia sp. AMX1]MBC6927589.1 pilus assembly protein [Candidatus Jettenia sp.]NUN23560.1 pilus assembly protein [Candidatus Jettenia caeni]KAA0251565.1 MAG: pilus assembly protein [Candidatus Jettenia sp. AMX1]MCE7881297.1 pilus assembly protein [Candidatus Jettenia sp. AMX1]MCQ3926013.1 pilus assembly protein [Candidatus Jettenia sp.]
MIKKYLVLISLAGMSLVSCATSRVEKDYGNSFQLVKSNQILNPEAGKNLDPVHGLDGHAALIVMEKYRKGFEIRSAPPMYPIGVTIGQTSTR